MYMRLKIQRHFFKRLIRIFISLKVNDVYTPYAMIGRMSDLDNYFVAILMENFKIIPELFCVCCHTLAESDRCIRLCESILYSMWTAK